MRKRAIDVADSDRLPRIPEWSAAEGEGVMFAGRMWPAPVFLDFLGRYLSDGSTSKPAAGPWQVKITKHRTRPERRNVECVMQRLFGEIWPGEDAVYAPVSEGIAIALRALGDSATKRIPPEILGLGRQTLRVLFDGLIAGDGSKRPSEWKGHPEWKFRPELSFSTSSPGLADDMTELALKAGYRPTTRVREPETVTHQNGTYTAKRPQHEFGFGRNVWSAFRRDLVRREAYTGPVIGIEMERNPIVLVRRDGKTLWTGNCRCTMRLVVD